MKYNYKSQLIPRDKRKDLNEKILYLLNSNQCEKYNITAEDIYNCYTGRGQTENINFNEYDSYYDYSQARKKIEEGEFFTAPNICQFVMDILRPSVTDLICDMTSGIGNFCNHATEERNFYLNDNNLNNTKIMRFLYPSANITNDDILHYNPKVKFDIIVGNPPYGLKFSNYTSQFYYCIKANELLKPLGFLAIIIPNSFLNDDFKDKSQIEFMNNSFNFICQFDLPTNSFKQVGINYIETKVMLFQKKSNIVTEYNTYNLSKISIDSLNFDSSNTLHDQYILPLKNQKLSLKAQLFFENVKINKDEDIEFNLKVQKLLFDIKRNPKVRHLLSKGEAYYNEYFTQKKPEDMNWQEWNNIRITQKKVIKYLKQLLTKQHETEKDEIKLVKYSYGLKYKGYSDKTKLTVSKINDNTKSFNDMVLSNNYNFDNTNYKRLVNKKIKQYNRQTIDFQDMKLDNNIQNWLSNNLIYNIETEENLILNDIQKDIVNKMLQKKYGYIQASQGSGKTLMSINYAMYRQQYNSIKNVFVVAPSIAINGTWESVLTAYQMPFITLKSFSDINKIKQGDYVLITFNMIIKLQKHVKKHLKRISNKYLLLVDEADSIARFESKRTKTTLGTFRKAKYKLLLSGTMTRNNITEAYTQFQLLYNSSINFISNNQYIYTEDKDTKELKEECNKYYNRPFPEYRKGFELFRDSFNPAKVSVFGIDKSNQNIYNSTELKELINKTIITKTFEEVTGRKIYEIIQHTVKFNSAERSLYNTAINEFYNMKYLFTSTGNPRKDRMMEIIQQITLMLNICQHPQTYKEYNSSETPSKYKKVLSLLMDWNNERVAIGCRTIKEVECYHNLIRNKFPNRRIFVVTGNTTTMKQRKDIIKQLKETDNGILLSTQQSLSSSINIGFVNKVICTALAWNFSSLSQWFFRFIRYDSKDNKEVHFITYENSLENNLLALLMVKENLTLFMKNQEMNDDELYEEFGIDFNLLDMLLTKEKDHEGKVRISWGQQEIM